MSNLQAINSKIQETFKTLTLITESVAKRHIKALILAGSPGLGKSHTVLSTMQQSKVNHYVISGSIKATGLYKALHDNRSSIVIVDDADQIFSDETSLNLLKAACDTKENRIISWLSETKMVDTNEIPIERSFNFTGSLVVITNYDIEAMANKKTKLAPHLKALLSRSHYFNLNITCHIEYLVRIITCINNGLLNSYNLSYTQKQFLVKFLEQNANDFRELSLRTAIKVAEFMTYDPNNWELLAKITLTKA